MLSKDGFWCELRCAVAHTCSVVPESSLTPSGVSRGALRACYRARHRASRHCNLRRCQVSQSLSTRLHDLLEVSFAWILLTFLFPFLLVTLTLANIDGARPVEA